MNILITSTGNQADAISELLAHKIENSQLPQPADMIWRHELTGGWVDLHSGELEPSPQDDWLDFTTRWVAETRRTSGRVHYAMLAQAMSRADDQRFDWNFYRERALVNLQIAVALFNGTNEARRRKLERSGGWQLTHDGKRWQLSNGDTCVAAKAISAVLELAEAVQERQDSRLSEMLARAA